MQSEPPNQPEPTWPFKEGDWVIYQQRNRDRGFPVKPEKVLLKKIYKDGSSRIEDRCGQFRNVMTNSLVPLQ